MEEFERNRVPGASILGIPTSLVALGASIALTGGPGLGEKIAQHMATGAFEGQQLTRHGSYIKNYRPAYFGYAKFFRGLGWASWGATVGFGMADITTAIYTWATFDCQE
jgi:hypothetical protein